MNEKSTFLGDTTGSEFGFSQTQAGGLISLSLAPGFSRVFTVFDLMKTVSTVSRMYHEPTRNS